MGVGERMEKALKFPPRRSLAGLISTASHVIGPAGEGTDAKPGGKKLERTELSRLDRRESQS